MADILRTVLIGCNINKLQWYLLAWYANLQRNVLTVDFPAPVGPITKMIWSSLETEDDVSGALSMVIDL